MSREPGEPGAAHALPVLTGSEKSLALGLGMKDFFLHRDLILHTRHTKLRPDNCGAATALLLD